MTSKELDSDSISEETGQKSDKEFTISCSVRGDSRLGRQTKEKKNLMSQEVLKQNRELATNNGVEEGSH